MNILFYDGPCALCNFTVNTLVKFEKKNTTDRLNFSTLQGKTASELLDENLLNELGNIKIKENQLDQISVTIKSLVVIASKELQNVINFDDYKNQLIGKSKSINELNLIAKKMTKDYQLNDFPKFFLHQTKPTTKVFVQAFYHDGTNGQSHNP